MEWQISIAPQCSSGRGYTICWPRTVVGVPWTIQWCPDESYSGLGVVARFRLHVTLPERYCIKGQRTREPLLPFLFCLMNRQNRAPIRSHYISTNGVALGSCLVQDSIPPSIRFWAVDWKRSDAWWVSITSQFVLIYTIWKYHEVVETNKWYEDWLTTRSAGE